MEFIQIIFKLYFPCMYVIFMLVIFYIIFNFSVIYIIKQLYYNNHILVHYIINYTLYELL